MERFYAIHNTPIYLGRQGENNAREVAFDISHWLESYGAGDVFLAVKRSNETDLYPVPIRMDGSCVLWTVTAADVDVVGQGGECELSYTVGDTVVKSETWQTIVLESMDGDVTEAPIASQAWIDAQRKETAKQQKIADAAAKSAIESAQSAGIASSKASAAAKSAEQAAEAVKAVSDVTAEVNAAKDAAKDAKASQVAAENAKDAAQSAAESAAQDAVAAVDTELAGYVAAAQEAQRAAEKARDEAEQAVGGDFASPAYVDEKAATAESNAKKYTDDKLKDIDVDVTADEVTFADGETFQQKYDSGELTGRPGEPGQPGEPGGKGDPGAPGEPGAPATINGVNALTLNATSPIKATQSGDTLTLELDGDLPSGAKASTYTLTTSGWSDNGDGRFKQTITVPGVTTDAAQVIMVDAALTGTDLDADAATLSAWGADDGSGPSSQNVAQGDGTLTFYCKGKPTVNIPVFVGVS